VASRCPPPDAIRLAHHHIGEADVILGVRAYGELLGHRDPGRGRVDQEQVHRRRTVTGAGEDDQPVAAFANATCRFVR